MNESYGASATVSIHCDGALEQLAKQLSLSLGINEIAVEPSEYPPHDVVGSAEVMGMELWLYRTSPSEICLKIETTNSHEEIFAGRMYDLSVWLSRLIRTTCDLDATPSEVASG
jgi:hypothetical protein